MALYQPDPEITSADLIDELGRVLAVRYMNAEDELIREIARRAYRDIELQAALQVVIDEAKPGIQYAIERNRQLAELAGYRAQTLRDLQSLAVQVTGRLNDEHLAQDLIDTAAARVRRKRPHVWPWPADCRRPQH